MGHYSDYQAKDLEPVEVTQEMIVFLQKLNDLLHNQAGLDSTQISDRPRLKGYFENPEQKGSYIEMDVLKGWQYYKVGDRYQLQSESGRPQSKFLDEFENELYTTDFSIDGCILSLQAGSKEQSLLLHTKCLMELAQSGKLFVTKPGELIKDAHPIVLQDNGDLLMCPSLKDCPEEDKGKEPFLSADQKLQCSPHYNDQEYANRLKKASENLSTFAIKGILSGLERNITDLATEAMRKNLSKTAFLKQISEADMGANEKLEEVYQKKKDDNPNLPSYTFQFSSGKRQQEGVALSQKAMAKYAAGQYDILAIYEPIIQATKEGEFTQEECKSITSQRDVGALLLDISDDPQIQSSNIDYVKMMIGKGLDPADPQYEEFRQRMYAQYVNKRLKDIAEFDYEKYCHLTDQEFVDKYQEFNAAFFRTSVLRMQLDQMRANPYLDRKLVQKCYQIADTYADTHMYNQCKIRFMASPYYGKYDLKQLENVSNEDMLKMNPGRLSNEVAYRKTIQELETLRTSKGLMLECYIQREMISTKKAEREQNIRLYNQDGQEIESFQLPDCINRGEIIYAADIYHKGNLSAFKMNPETLAITSVPLTKKMQNTVNTINSNIDTVLSHTATSLNELFYNPQKLKAESYESVCKEIIKKGLNPNQIYSKIKEHFNDKNDRYNETEFYAFFEKQGKKPHHLSKEEIAAREAVTQQATKKDFDANMAAADSFNVSNAEDIPFANPRYFTFFLFDYQAGAKKYNESVITRFKSGEEGRNEVIREAVERHLANAELFSRDLTDEELIQNWDKIRATGLAIGQEYLNFKKTLAEDGISMPDDAAQKLEAVEGIISLKNAIYSNRMSVLMSRYHKFGAEDVVNSAADGFSISPLVDDPEFSEYANAMSTFIIQQNNAVGYYANQHMLGPEEVPMVVFDETGNEISGSQEIGQAFREGKGVFYVNNQGEIKGCKPQDFKKVPPVFENIAVTPEVKVATDIYQVMKQDLPEYEKLYQSTLLKEQYNLNKMTANPSGQDFQKQMKESLTNLCAAISINKLIQKNGVEDSVKKAIGTQKTLDAVRDGMRKSGLIETMMENHLPKKPQEIAQMNPETLYFRMLQAHSAENAKQAQMMERQRLEELFYRTHDRALSKYKENYFFKTITKPEIMQLKEATSTSLTLQRSSLQTITLSMMLTQGYSFDEAIAPEAKEDRDQIGRAAMEAIKAGDYQMIEQNLTIGLNNLNTYVHEKMMKLESIEPRFVLQPQNENFILAASVLKDFSQELERAQGYLPKRNLPPEQKTSDVSYQAMVTAESLATLFSIAGVRGHDKLESASIGSLIGKYIQGDIMNKRFQYKRSLPENEGKKIDEIMTLEDINAAQRIFSNSVVPRLNEMIPKTKVGQENLTNLIKTDSVHTLLNTGFMKEGDQLVFKAAYREKFKGLDKQVKVEGPSLE